MPIVEDVVTQHFEDAAFLWSVRRRAVRAPHFARTELSKLDGRIDANLDGLRIAGEEGWTLARCSTGAGGAGEAFTAAVLALEKSVESFEQVFATARSWEAMPGLVSAMAWSEAPLVNSLVAQWGGSADERRRFLSVAAKSCRRAADSEFVDGAVADISACVRARGFRAIGELGRADMGKWLQRGMSDEDSRCRFWAAWSACLTGHREAGKVLLAAAEAGEFRRDEALDLATRCLGVQDAFAWHQDLARGGRLREAAIVARALGSPRLVPWLIDAMAVDQHARVAGEAFSWITGCDLAMEDLERDAPTEFEAGPNDNPEDDDVEMDPDEDLAWPDPGLVREWWGRHSPSFGAGECYLRGKRLDDAGLIEVLDAGSQRQRTSAALEIALRRPGTPLIETRARAQR